MTGMGKTFIYDRMKDGTFPKQIQLGSRSVVWNEQEVIKWVEEQMAPRCPRRAWDNQASDPFVILKNTNLHLEMILQEKVFWKILCIILAFKSLY